MKTIYVTFQIKPTAYCMSLGYETKHYEQSNAKEADKFLENFFSVCGVRILQAAQKVGLNPYRYAA